MPTREEHLEAAQRLHAHLRLRHFDRGLLRGPDPGVRFNLRLWRFLKSALDFVPWQDDYVFMQTMFGIAAEKGKALRKNIDERGKTQPVAVTP